MTITLDECIPRINGARVAVTGGAGFIGSHLVDFLLRQGAERVVVIDDLTRPRAGWLDSKKDSSHLQFIHSSILDGDPAAMLTGMDVVYHLAAISRVMDALRQPEKTFAVNVLGTVRVAEAARQVGIRRMVFTSSREVYGEPKTLPVAEDAPLNPKNIYGASKIAAELYLSTLSPKELEVVVFRLANVYGPGDSGRVLPTFVTNALQGLPLVLYGGDQVLDFMWIDEVVKVLVKAGFSAFFVPAPVNIGSGVGTPLRVLAKRVLELINNSGHMQIDPPRNAEVERFQADITRAKHYYGMTLSADPLARLPDVLLDIKR